MTDPITDLLARARTEVDTDLLRPEASALAAAVRRSAPRRRPRRRIAIGLAAVLVAAPTTAVALGYDVRTGLFGDPSRNTEDVDRSEWLNLCAASYPETVREHQPPASQPLPAALDWTMASEMIVAMTARGCADQGASVMQETGLVRQFNYWAQCAWLREGVAAIEAGDRARRDQAADALRHYGDSKVNHATDGGGIVEQDLAIAADVSSGDATRAREQVALNCGDFGVAR